MDRAGKSGGRQWNFFLKASVTHKDKVYCAKLSNLLLCSVLVGEESSCCSAAACHQRGRPWILQYTRPGAVVGRMGGAGSPRPPHWPSMAMIIRVVALRRDFLFALEKGRQVLHECGAVVMEQPGEEKEEEEEEIELEEEVVMADPRFLPPSSRLSPPPPPGWNARLPPPPPPAGNLPPPPPPPRPPPPPPPRPPPHPHPAPLARMRQEGQPPSRPCKACGGTDHADGRSRLCRARVGGAAAAAAAPAGRRVGQQPRPTQPERNPRTCREHHPCSWQPPRKPCTSSDWQPQRRRSSLHRRPQPSHVHLLQAYTPAGSHGVVQRVRVRCARNLR